jgi:hypothetical protein
MIDWPLLLAATIVRRGTIYNVVYDRYSDVALWIANRINRRLAGYEAVKRELEYVEEKTKALGRSTEFHAVLQISHIGREAEDAYK